MSFSIRLAAPKNPSEAHDIARVQVETWQTTYRGMICDNFLNALEIKKSEAAWARRLNDESFTKATLVAEDTLRNIVGFAYGGKNREANSKYEAELQAIYVLKSFQRQRLGSQLIKKFMQEMSSRNFSSLQVWVLEANHASRKFYEAMGGAYCGKRLLQIGDENLSEVSYVWASIK